MAGQALYRELRPNTFDGVIGQEHITDVLKKQVEKSSPSHAYLFYGPRGSGKTSSARILANALNCLSPKDGSPCGECEVCKACAAESFIDIIEMDAASNSSVEDVRGMLEKVPLLPASGKYKVYIIDEVHMFSKSAFNALLKTLEEPPSHVVFIFATTELSKVPKTIFSRTQRYGFKRLNKKLIEDHLIKVLNDRNIAFEERAVSRLAVFADGAMRDALSLLDQCISNGEVTDASVTEILGIPSEELSDMLCGAIMSRDIKQAVKITNDMLNDGISSSEILTGCASRFTDMLIEKADSPLEREKILSAIWALNQAQNLIKYTNIQSAVTIAAVVRAADGYAAPPDKNLPLEVKHLKGKVAELEELLKNAPKSDTSITYEKNDDGELAKRVDVLEKRLKKAADLYSELKANYNKLKAFVIETAQNPDAQIPQNAQPLSAPAEYAAADLEANIYDPNEDLSLLYSDSESQLRALRELALAEDKTLKAPLDFVNKLEMKDGKLLLYVKKDDAGITDYLKRAENKPVLDNILTEIYGTVPEIEFVEFEEEDDNAKEVAEYLGTEGGFEEVKLFDKLLNS